MSPHDFTAYRQFWLLLALTGLITALGCSGASGPALPESPAPQSIDPHGLLPIATGDTSAIAPLGLYEIRLDVAHDRASITPMPVRGGAAFDLGDSLIPDLTALFTDPAGLCGDCMTLSRFGVDPNGDVYFEVDLKHPLATGRPELSAFDIQGVLISDEPGQTLIDVPTFGVKTYAPYLKNADGATAQITAAVEDALGTTLDADVFPFKNFAVDATAGNFAGANVNGFADVANPSGHNVFASGDTAIARYVLDESALSEIRIVLALTGSFYRSYTTRGSALFQKNNPVYFLPEANRKEAWQVTIEVNGSALLAGDPTSAADLTLTIQDWQNGLTADPTWDPAEADPAIQPRDAIPATSDVQSIAMFVPGLTASNVDLTAIIPTGTGRTAADPLVYDGIRVLNTASAGPGEYVGLVRVTDSRATEAAGPGEGDIFFRDAITFGTLPAFETYAIFSLTVQEEVAFIGSDFFASGHLISRTGDAVTVEEDHFAGLGGAISNAAIRNGRVYLVSAGPAFSGNGAIQVFDAASGNELIDFALPAASNPFDLAFIDADEAYVTGYNTASLYRVNIDPAFAGNRLINTTDLSSTADVGFAVRPTEVIRTSGGRVFVVGNHLDGGFSPAPAGLLIEINPATDAMITAHDTTGARNTGALVEVPGAGVLTVIGSGTFAGGDGRSGRFTLGTNTWSIDPAPASPRDWGELAVTSTARGFMTDFVLATMDHVGLPSTGAISHVLPVLNPPAPPFPFVSDVGVDSGDYLYVTEFNTGTLRVFDASSANNGTPPVQVALFDLPDGTDAIGVTEQ